MRDKKIIFLVVLGIVVLISLARAIIVSSRKNITYPPAELARSQEAYPGLRRGVSKFTSFVRNPFVPKAKEVIIEMRIVLNGIVWDAHKPVAMINDKVLGVGESFNDKITVVQIKPDRVIFNNGESDFELKLGQSANQP